MIHKSVSNTQRMATAGRGPLTVTLVHRWDGPWSFRVTWSRGRDGVTVMIAWMGRSR